MHGPRAVLLAAGVLSALLVLAVGVAVVVVMLGSEDGGQTGARTAAEATASAAEPTQAATPDARAAAPAPPRPAPSPAAGDAQPGAAPTLTFVGGSALDGASGDIAVLDGYAFVGGYRSGANCPGAGVRVVDLADPANPRMVATAAGFPGTTSEDVVALNMSTLAFTGRLLAAGIQRCGQGAGRGGLALVDVTDPANPQPLSFFDTSPGPSGVHELDAVVRQDGRVLALLAVPLSESQGVGDLRIVEITDPRRPVQLAHWGAAAAFGMTDGVGCVRRNQVHAHSARANPDGTRAYVSYWDAGLAVLDIREPSRPRLLGRLFEPGEEGNIHSVDEMGGDLLLVTEEISRPYQLRLRLDAGGRSEELVGCESPGASLKAEGARNGPLADAGQACGDLPAPPAGAVALATAGGCTLAEKARAAQLAGASALLIAVPGSAASVADATSDTLALPVVSVGERDAERLRAALREGAATVTLPMGMAAGGVRVWDIADPARPARRAIFRTERAADYLAAPPGNFTARNPVGLGRYALVSWFGDGVRLLDLADPARPREVASWSAENGSRIWGVAVSGDLVVLSDVRDGLYVLRLSGLPGR